MKCKIWEGVSNKKLIIEVAIGIAFAIGAYFSGRSDSYTGLQLFGLVFGIFCMGMIGFGFACLAIEREWGEDKD